MKQEKKMKKILGTGVLCSVLLLITACATSIKTYEGNTLSLEESAILTCEPFLSIRGIDGNPELVIASGGGLWFRDCVVSLTPGKHSVRVRYVTGGTVSISTDFIILEHDYEKGKIYRVKYTTKGGLWHPWIEELKGEELATQRQRVINELAEKK